MDQDRIINNCSGVYAGDVPVSMAVGVASKKKPGNGLHDIVKEAEGNMYSQRLNESRNFRKTVLASLLKTLAEKSYETEIHVNRMQKTAKMIGQQTGISKTDQDRLELLITLHDIGKINMPEKIFTKKEPLDADEWEIIKKHSEIGFRIARSTEMFAHVAEEILAHHENWDGSGYPRGLKMEEIPFLSRITAIADACEVMSSGRPYNSKKNREEIAAELKRCAGTQFDPTLVDLFLAIF